MKTSEKGIEFIKKFEGFSSKIYKCSAGYFTIGYGHKISANQESYKTNFLASSYSISRAKAHELLEKDISLVERSIHRNIYPSLRQNEFDALTSFTFNLGCGALQRSSLRQKINYGDFEAAAAEFIKWVFAGGRRVRGLVVRRNAERALFAQADYGAN